MPIFKCIRCGTYTLKDKCPSCSSETISSKPARVSPSDRHGKYRRMMKKHIRKNVH